MDVAVLALAGGATALATGLGAVPVFLLGPRAERLRPFLWGSAVGLMAVASIVGLLLPAVGEGDDLAVARSGGRGRVSAHLAAPARARRRTRRQAAWRRRPALDAGLRRAARAQPAGGIRDRDRVRLGHARPRALHRAGDRTAERPGGTSVAIPMESAGFGAAQQFWAAVLTS